MAKLLTWFRTGERTSGAFYFLLAVAIMLPLFRPGYLLALDLSWTPNIPVQGITNNYFLLFLVLHLIKYVVASQLIEKFLLFGILWLAASGMHRLVKTWGTSETWACYFAGILYLFSPFAYSRFLAGQYLILLAYALIPWFVAALWNFLTIPDIRSSARLLLWTLAVSIVDLHSIFVMALLSVVSVVGFIVTGKIEIRPLLKWGSSLILAWIVLSSYWLLPLLFGTSSTATWIQSFNTQMVRAFETVGDPRYGLLFNAAAMYGFWVDRLGHYILPKSDVGIWPILAILFIVLAFIGLVAERRRVFTWILSITGLVAFVLGVGAAYPPFAHIFYFLFNHVPFFKGDRESEVFIGLLVMTYCFLGAIGASWIANFAKRRLRGGTGEVIGGILLPLVIMISPIVYNPIEMWGFEGQLKPTNYPSDWYAVNSQLDSDKSNFQVLFLPWHMYLSFSFTSDVIYNPATSFFDKPTIQGNDIQIAGVYTEFNTPTSLYVNNHILPVGPSVHNIGVNLDHLNIKYVVVAKNFDVGQYDWLNKQTDLTRIDNTKNLLVYRNDSWKAAR
jgi:hypothetical protein